jgi:hypothetical protein
MLPLLNDAIGVRQKWELHDTLTTFTPQRPAFDCTTELDPVSSPSFEQFAHLQVKPAAEQVDVT